MTSEKGSHGITASNNDFTVWRGMYTAIDGAPSFARHSMIFRETLLFFAGFPIVKVTALSPPDPYKVEKKIRRGIWSLQLSFGPLFGLKCVGSVTSTNINTNTTGSPQHQHCQHYQHQSSLSNLCVISSICYHFTTTTPRLSHLRWRPAPPVRIVQRWCVVRAQPQLCRSSWREMPVLP